MVGAMIRRRAIAGAVFSRRGSVVALEAVSKQGQVTRRLGTSPCFEPAFLFLERIGKQAPGIFLIEADPADREGVAGLRVDRDEGAVQAGVAGGDVEVRRARRSAWPTSTRS